MADPEEFYDLLQRAYDGDLTEPLLNHVEQVELTPQERRDFVAWVRHVLRRPIAPPYLPIRTIEKNVAHLVEVMRDMWRTQHRVQRVPAPVTEMIIDKAIKETAATWGMAPERLSAEAIRRELKTGRIKMP